MRSQSLNVLLLSLSLLSLFIAPVRAEPRRFALVVGVREYPVSDKLTPLAFTEPDANQLAATLQQGKFQVTLMTQTVSKGASQERFNPNAALIRKQFRDLAGEPFLTKEDCLLVILEGHGIQLPSRADAENLTFYFCPGDAQIDDLKFSDEVKERHNLIPVAELYDLLKRSGAGVKLLVVDACRNDHNKVDNFRSANSVTRPPVPEPPGGTAVLLSCSANQRAAEDPALKHGVFSYFLIEALTGKADLDGDRQINVTELYNYVGSRTYSHVRQKYSTQQMPEFKGEIRGWAPLISFGESTFAGTRAGDLWDKNSLRIKFRWCPPGSFKMGSPATEKDRKDNENQVNVTLTQGFWLGQHEVTQAEWTTIMGTTPWMKQPNVKEGDNYAASYVSWLEASEFCTRLTAKGHREGWLPTAWKLDLPTEAQWEYACRAGTTTRYFFGDDASKLGDYAWFEKNVFGVGEEYNHPVGRKKPNPWGLHDIYGNNWEWCRDWYRDQLPGGTDPDFQEKSLHRVARGGGWNSYDLACRSAPRVWDAPDTRASALGFRVAIVQTR